MSSSLFFVRGYHPETARKERERERERNIGCIRTSEPTRPLVRTVFSSFFHVVGRSLLPGARGARRNWRSSEELEEFGVIYESFMSFWNM